jgi:hypothetical protein
MASTFKSYKKLVFMTEAELKKDWSRAFSKNSKIFLGRWSFLKQRWMFGTCCYEQKHLKGNDQPNYCVETASYCLVFYRNATFFFKQNWLCNLTNWFIKSYFYTKKYVFFWK